MRTLGLIVISFLMVLTSCSVVKKNGIKQSRKYNLGKGIIVTKNLFSKLNLHTKEEESIYDENLKNTNAVADIGQSNRFWTSRQKKVAKVESLNILGTESKSIAMDSVTKKSDKASGVYQFKKVNQGISIQQITGIFGVLEKSILQADEDEQINLFSKKHHTPKRKFRSFTKLQKMGLTIFMLGIASMVVFVELGSFFTFTFFGLYAVILGSLFFIVGSLQRAKKLKYIWIKGALYTLSIFLVMFLLLLFAVPSFVGVFTFTALFFLYLYLVFWMIKR